MGSIIWESNTIIRYLAAEYGAERLWPEQPLQRSYAERWMDWELATLQPDFIDLFWAHYRTPQSERKTESIERYLRRCSSHFNKLDQQLERQPYLAGESFSMGDIPCATSLFRYFEMGLEVEKPKYVLGW